MQRSTKSSRLTHKSLSSTVPPREPEREETKPESQDQEEATKELTRLHKCLKKAHKLLVHQFLEIAASTEALSHRLAWIRERFKYGNIGSCRDSQQGHARADKQGRKPKEGERG